MVKIRASCTASGEKFSPAAFAKINPVKLFDTNESGEIATKGRHRGKPEPGGSATIAVSEKAEEDWSRFDEFLTLVEGCVDDLRKTGADDIFLSVSLFHDGQCNFGFSKEEFERIAALKLDMAISCYGEDAE